MYERQIRRGDIYYAELGKTIGSVQGKLRPVVVLQNNQGNKHSPTLIVATITSKSRKKRSFPTHVVFRMNDLPVESVVQLEQITTIDKKQLLNYVSQMPSAVMLKVDEAIKISLALQEHTERGVSKYERRDGQTDDVSCCVGVPATNRQGKQDG